ncbi:28S ribosomal protein S33, mitochondrial-like [Mercenaria mercenaria]|uniref:28S ribosomal protein S33, mitochondrial-like n=1 Tax=Mercenaria mercenaria TaxID=6596 RepID=UPI001E1DC1FF|nr:28S ribosomal protein S33, mitochondrial-like [Mercenaria mercenaria]
MSSSKYAQRMARLSARIFGEVARPTDTKSMRVVKIFSGKPAHLDPNIVDYYPRHRELKQLMDGLRAHGLFRDEHEDFKDEMRKRREARGKNEYVPYHLRGKKEGEGK